MPPTCLIDLSLSSIHALLLTAGVCLIVSAGFSIWALVNVRRTRLHSQQPRQEVDETMHPDTMADTAQTEAEDTVPLASPEETGDFKRLDTLIRQQKLYLRPDIRRNELARLIRVDKNVFAKIVYESTGGRLNDYLNGIRIEHAVRLMRTNKRYTLRAIAEASGFNNMTTFHNAFKKKIGMTPAQYWDSIR